MSKKHIHPGMYGKYKTPAEVLPEDMENDGGVPGGFPCMKVQGGDSRLNSQYIRGRAERLEERAREQRVRSDSDRFQEITDDLAQAFQQEKGQLPDTQCPF